MAHELILSPDRRYLMVKVIEEAALQEISNIVQEAVKICRELHVTRVLVDARHVSNAISRLDLLSIATALPSAGFLPGTRFAVLVDLETPEINYFDKVAASRGAAIDHYINYDEALDDLLAPAFG